MIMPVQNYSYIKINNTNNKILSQKGYSTFLCDTFELQNRKNIPFRGVKKSFFEKIGLINSKKDTAIKVIQEEYEKLSDEIMLDFENKGLTFQKPKLEFKKLPDDVNADYHMWDNSIVINSKKLSIENWYKSEALPNLFSYLPQNMASTGLKQVSPDEFRLIVKSMLAHELQHAKQIQTTLHLKNAKDTFIEGIKTYYNLPSDEIKRLFPFIFEFEPKREIEPCNNLIFQNVGLKVNEFEFHDCKNLKQLDDGDYVLFFSPETIIKSMVKINRDYSEYLTNLSELDAIIAEYQMLKSTNIDNDILKEFIKVKRNQIKRIFDMIYMKKQA